MQNTDRNFTDLEIWQEAHRLTIEIYKICKKFPKEEQYSLVSQVQRAAISVDLNIAESYGRYHFAEEIHFLYNARGSAREVQACLLIAKDLKYIVENVSSQLFSEYNILIKRMNSYIKYKKNAKK